MWNVLRLVIIGIVFPSMACTINEAGTSSGQPDIDVVQVPVTGPIADGPTQNAPAE